jgi:glycosyltransferase involved in cell wall biosynthesis
VNILVVTTSYPRFPGDPAGNFVGAHVAAMQALGHEVEVIAAGDAGGLQASGFRLQAAERIPSTLFYRGGAPDEIERSWRAVPKAALFTMRIALAVRRSSLKPEARSPKPLSLLVSHWLAPSAIAALPARVPLLAIAHGGDVHLLRKLRLLAPVLHALRARGARLAFVTEELLAIARAAAPSLERWLADAAIVQPMGIDVGHFARIPRTPTNPPTILVAARLVPVKGVDVALEALRHVHAHAQLRIAGDGPERLLLEARAPERAEFLGMVPTAERDRLLGEASLVVVPSRVLRGGRSEGLPLVALEALAAGVPVVASDVGGLRSLAPHVTLVPPEDPRALASAIDRVLLGGAGGFQSPETLRGFDWPHVAARLIAHAA